MRNVTLPNEKIEAYESSPESTKSKVVEEPKRIIYD
jgi:hypothetical protein